MSPHKDVGYDGLWYNLYDNLRNELYDSLWDSLRTFLGTPT